MDLTKLEQVLADRPPFRLKQIKRLVLHNFIDSWEAASNLDKALREELAAACPLAINGKIQVAKDNSTVKALITFADGLAAETVLIKHQDGRQTICVSSQIGCPLGCKFCASGRMGFKRNLTAEEIVEQGVFWARHCEKRIDNIVFMGMGEPLLNYDQVIRAIRVFNNSEYFNIGIRHISISTVGIIPGLQKLTKEAMDVNLAWSLHAPTDLLRNRIMPINMTYPLHKVLAELAKYYQIKKRKLMIEYILLDNVNDSPENAADLAELLLAALPPTGFFINLIAYNKTVGFRPSSVARIKAFKQILQRRHIDFSQRFSFGQDVAGACGQLALACKPLACESGKNAVK